MAEIGDVVRIDCPQSKYNGVIGEIYNIQDSTEYAIVDMPAGTELRIERIRENTILRQMRQSEKDRKTSITRWPKGDPQWFPLRWLTLLKSSQTALDLEVTEVAR